MINPMEMLKAVETAKAAIAEIHNMCTASENLTRCINLSRGDLYGFTNELEKSTRKVQTLLLKLPAELRS